MRGSTCHPSLQLEGPSWAPAWSWRNPMNRSHLGEVPRSNTACTQNAHCHQHGFAPWKVFRLGSHLGTEFLFFSRKHRFIIATKPIGCLYKVHCEKDFFQESGCEQSAPLQQETLSPQPSPMDPRSLYVVLPLQSPKVNEKLSDTC